MAAPRSSTPAWSRTRGPGPRCTPKFELGRELALVPELAGTLVRNEVAIVFDWDNWWALELDSHPSDAVRCLDRVLDHYAPLFEAGVGIDVVHPSADLSPYKLLVLPGHYLLSAENAARISTFVADGGSLLASFFTGIVDEHDRVHPGGRPAPLDDVLGVRVEEFWPAAADEAVPLRAPEADGPAAAAAPPSASLWREEVKLTGARAELFFAGPDWDDDRPAATVHAHGRGSARYVATRPDPVTMRALVDRSLAEAGALPVLPGLPAGIQATIRHGAGHDVLILLNHTEDEQEVALPAARRDLLDAHRPLVRRVTLAPRGVAVLGSGGN